MYSTPAFGTKQTFIFTFIPLPPYPPTATLADSPATSSTPAGNLSI